MTRASSSSPRPGPAPLELPLSTSACRLTFAQAVRSAILAAGLPAGLAGRAEIVAGELAGNAARHAGGGRARLDILGETATITISDAGRPLTAADFEDGPPQLGAGAGRGLGAALRLSEAVSQRVSADGKQVIAHLNARWSLARPGALELGEGSA